MVLFVVTGEGAPEKPQLMRSSGHQLLDEAAVAHMASCIGQYILSDGAPLPEGRYALPMVWRLE